MCRPGHLFARDASRPATGLCIYKILRLNQNENIVQIGFKHDTTVNSMPQSALLVSD